jgi:hypothetical protein
MTINPMHKARAAHDAEQDQSGPDSRVVRLQCDDMTSAECMVPGAPAGKRNGNYRHGARTK